MRCVSHVPFKRCLLASLHLDSGQHAHFEHEHHTFCQSHPVFPVDSAAYKTGATCLAPGASWTRQWVLIRGYLTHPTSV